MRLHFPLLLTAACLLQASCTVFRKSNHPSPVAMPEVQILARDPADHYRATATRVWELVHTGLDIRFNLRERSAGGEATLRLHPYFYDTDTVTLDAKGMRIASVTDAAGHSLSYVYDSLQLTVKLAKLHTVRDTLELKIRYTALPYADPAGGSSAIREDRGLYFINTDGAEPYQPVQIWTQGETQASSRWFPTFDQPVFRSAFTITMHVPDSFRTLSNGKLVHSVKEANGLRADTWEQRLPVPPYLVMMAAGNFAVVSEHWKGKEVSYYVPQQYGPWAKDIFRHTPEMISFFSGLLRVDFPWDKYSQVIGYNYVSGAMENVSASLFGAFNLKDRRQVADDGNDFIVAHELFHQWFGDYVTAESWSHLTLNESFADYSEHLWSEHKYGTEARQAVWMQGLAKYLAQARYNDPPLVRHHYRSQEDMFDRVSYSKGGLILHYMRQLAGDGAFFETLHRYLERNALHSAEAGQLRMALEEVTGRDWNWFFDQWYYRGGHPVLDVTYAYDDAAGLLRVKVVQQNDTPGLYRLPMKAQVISGGKAALVDWDIKDQEQYFEYSYAGGARPVVVPDAGHWMPGELRDHKNATQWQQQFLYAQDHISKRLALTACYDLKNNDTAQAVLLAALRDGDPVIRYMAVSAKAYKDHKRPDPEWVTLLGKIAAEDDDSKARAAALRALGDLDKAEYSSIMELATADSSYRVAAAGLYALNKVKPGRGRELARTFRPAQMMGNALLYQAAMIIAEEGKATDYPFFEKKTLELFEHDRQSFLVAFQAYMVHVRDEEVFRKGLDFLERLATADIAPSAAFYNGAILYNIMSYSAREKKVATDKDAIAQAAKRKELAALAWDSYKRSVTDEQTKVSIAELESE